MTAERDALERDAADPLAGFRERFAHPVGARGERRTYLCGNSLGLMPLEARRYVGRELDAWAERAVDAHFEGADPWYGYHELVRDGLARLAGALPHEVVAMNGLTANLHLMMATFYRPGPGRGAVVMEDCAFPSDTYAVRSQIAWHGLDPDRELIVARPRAGETTLRIEDVEGLLERRGESVALVLLSGVQYFTGQRFDLARVARAARAAGAIVGFDLAHAIGNVPLALHDDGCDFAVWCSYKYLNAGPGSIAGCFVHERHGLNLALPRLAGWWGNDPARRFRMHLEPEFVPREGADGWQLGNPPILAIAPLRASLALFDEARPSRLREKSIAMTGFLQRLVEDIPGDRFEILTPRDPESRGCQLSIRVRRDGRGLFDELHDLGFVGDYREPDVIRVAPVPLYNTFHDVWRFGSALAAHRG